MSKKIFLYKEKNTNDRDCVNYIEIEQLDKLECGHYFSRISLQGACFSKGLDIDEIDFDNITTILTKEDFINLDNYNKKIGELGYGLDEQPDKIELAHKYYEEIKPIIYKLESEDNEKIFLQVQEEEKEFLANETDLDYNEIEELFNAVDNIYAYYYRDRGIIGTVYEDYEKLGESQFESNIANVPEYLKNYIDYAQFGEDLAQEENYVELDNGKIVELML